MHAYSLVLSLRICVYIVCIVYFAIFISTAYCRKMAFTTNHDSKWSTRFDEILWHEILSMYLLIGVVFIYIVLSRGCLVSQGYWKNTVTCLTLELVNLHHTHIFNLYQLDPKLASILIETWPAFSRKIHFHHEVCTLMKFGMQHSTSFWNLSDPKSRTVSFTKSYLSVVSSYSKFS